MATTTQICNLALIKIGNVRISDINDGSVNANICKDYYAFCRQMILQEFHWSFAIKRVNLAESSTAPEFTYARKFPLPSDCLTVIAINPENEWVMGDNFTIEDRHILTNDDDVNLIYLRDVEDESLFPPLFSEAFATLLASKIAGNITDNANIVQSLVIEYKRNLSSARAADSRQSMSGENSLFQRLKLSAPIVKSRYYAP